MDGVQQDAKGSFTLTMGGPKLSPIVGADRIHGAKEEQMPGSIEGVLTDRGDLSIRDLLDYTGSVTIELRNGKSYILPNAFYGGDGALDTEEGEIGITYYGDPMIEQLANA
jgi:hypothetical protein